MTSLFIYQVPILPLGGWVVHVYQCPRCDLNQQLLRLLISCSTNKLSYWGTANRLGLLAMEMPCPENHNLTSKRTHGPSKSIGLVFICSLMTAQSSALLLKGAPHARSYYILADTIMDHPITHFATLSSIFTSYFTSYLPKCILMRHTCVQSHIHYLCCFYHASLSRI